MLIKVTQKDIDIAIALVKHTGDRYSSVSPLSIAFSRKLKINCKDNCRYIYTRTKVEPSYNYTTKVLYYLNGNAAKFSELWCWKKFEKIVPQTFRLKVSA